MAYIRGIKENKTPTILTNNWGKNEENKKLLKKMSY